MDGDRIFAVDDEIVGLHWHAFIVQIRPSGQAAQIRSWWKNPCPHGQIALLGRVPDQLMKQNAGHTGSEQNWFARPYGVHRLARCGDDRIPVDGGDEVGQGVGRPRRRLP
ncbi:hypothetical protein CIK06_23430 [Plantactinospora sp. KBS50]|nr:hypothetical protein CIK06_23430 [Plantactinospora sp. KBS50]